MKRIPNIRSNGCSVFSMQKRLDWLIRFSQETNHSSELVFTNCQKNGKSCRHRKTLDINWRYYDSGVVLYRIHQYLYALLMHTSTMYIWMWRNLSARLFDKYLCSNHQPTTRWVHSIIHDQQIHFYAILDARQSWQYYFWLLNISVHCVVLQCRPVQHIRRWTLRTKLRNDFVR